MVQKSRPTGRFAYGKAEHEASSVYERLKHDLHSTCARLAIELQRTIGFQLQDENIENLDLGVKIS